jgi:hypothetical protein
MLPWVISAVAALVALGSWMRVGRLARKLEALNQSYWELRYDFTRLRSQVTRLDPETAQAESAPPSPSTGMGGGETVAFVPLSSMKKRDG